MTLKAVPVGPYRPRGVVARGLLSTLAAAVVLMGATPAAADVTPSEPLPQPAVAGTTSARGRITASVPLGQVTPQTCFPIPDPGGGGGGGGDDCLPPPPPPPLSCGFSLTYSIRPLPMPDTSLFFSRIGWSATIDCSPPWEIRISGRTRLVERTPGQPDGQPLAEGSQFNELKPPGQPAFVVSAGFLDVDGLHFPGAQQVEALLEYSIEVVRGDGVWGPCPELPGLRNLSCGGTGTKTATGVIGTYPFDTQVVRFCPVGSVVASLGSNPVESTYLVTAPDNTLLAGPTVKAQWCKDSAGNVTKLSIVSTSPNRFISELDGKATGNTAAQQVQKNGKIAYDLNFDMEYEFKVEYTVGPVTFQVGTKCAVAIHLTYTDSSFPISSTINPCNPWRPATN